MGAAKYALLRARLCDRIKTEYKTRVRREETVVREVRILTDERLRALFAPRPRDCHKGTFGTVGLIGGCIRYSGAAKLANLALSALRAGCGISRLAVPESLTQAVLPYLVESTLYPLPVDESGNLRYTSEAAEGFLRGLTAVGCGMGWDENPAGANYLEAFLAREGLTLLLDAGALGLLAKNPALLRSHTARVILTPHPGEFSRLTGASIPEILAHPQEMAEGYAREHDCILLLKGTETIVTNGEETYRVDRGGAGMATGGSGDVLSGVLTGMMGYLGATPEIVAAGAYLAGVAGELAEEKMTDIAMTARDTVEALPAAIRLLREEK